MNKQISAVLLSLSMLAGSTVAFAAPQGQEQDKHTQHQNVQHQNAAQHSNTKSSNTKNQGNERKAHADQRKGQTAQKSPAQVKKSSKHQSQYKSGQRLPKQYRDDFVDYKKHKLPKPPKNQRWVKVDGDYILISVATGVIASIILGS